MGTLRKLAELLVDVHGQRENYSLLQPVYQLELLDAFGKLTDLRREYVAAAGRVRELRMRHKTLAEVRQVASGGELSRTMLALKTVLAAHDPVRTLVVFDEIDANVGGRLGDVLGQKLARLGLTHQVLCVTHLPQVASYAGAHWTIRKQSTGKRTTTTIVPLGSDADRVEELATMLRGESRSDTTRKEAAEMLKAARRSA